MLCSLCVSCSGCCCLAGLAVLPKLALSCCIESLRLHVCILCVSELAWKRRQELAGIEINGLKIAEDRSFADCARYILTSVMALCGPAPPRTREEYIPLFCACPVATGTPVRTKPTCSAPTFPVARGHKHCQNFSELSWNLLPGA